MENVSDASSRVAVLGCQSSMGLIQKIGEFDNRLRHAFFSYTSNMLTIVMFSRSNHIP